MAPIINPPAYSSTAHSWQAWGLCTHLDKETTQDACALLAVPEGTKDKSDPQNANENGTHDQALGRSKETGELASDEGAIDVQIENNDGITEQRGNFGTSDTVISSACDQRSEITEVGTTKQDFSADHVFASSSKEIQSSPKKPGQATDSTQKQELARDSCVSKDERKVPFCPDCEKLRQKRERPFLSKSKSCSKFVWNRYLLKGFEGAVHSDWILHIVNGFVGQSGILSFIIINFGEISDVQILKIIIDVHMKEGTAY